MGDKLREMVEDESYDRFTFEEKMEMLIDAEAAARRERKVAKLVKDALQGSLGMRRGRRLSARPDARQGQETLDRLARCEWIGESEVVVVISKTGCGKSFVVQALGNAACRRLIPVRYTRLADICDDLNRARAAKDGSYFEKMDAYKSVALAGRRLHDDAVSTQNSVDLFEIMEAREGRRATVMASQLEAEQWYLRIEGELMADSILNRIATGARYVHTGPDVRVLRQEEAR